MNERENILRAVRFETPDHIPMSFHINGACWQHYPHDALQELMEDHPLLFPGFRRKSEVKPAFSPVQRKGRPYTDPWGCVWETPEDGITGTVTVHPLSDWSAFDRYAPPDPEVTDGLLRVDWDGTAERARRARERGDLVRPGLPHGHTFLRLEGIRGYENLIYDMADDEPRLVKLVDMIEEFNLRLVHKFVGMGAEWISYPEDLGMQVGPMLSPDHFGKYIRPSYERLMRPARDSGCVVHVHCDGDIRLLADEVIGCGADVLNLQDLVNGVDWIAERLAGRACIDLDVDRQKITPRGRPEDVDSLVREEVEKLGRKEGGLMMIYGLYPGVPLENVKALMDAMEKYA